MEEWLRGARPSSYNYDNFWRLSPLYQTLVRLEKFLIMHLRKEDRGKVTSYQLKKNTSTLRWLSPSFNAFPCTAVVRQLLPEFQRLYCVELGVLPS